MSKRLVIILWTLAGLLAAITLFVKSAQSKVTTHNTKLSNGDEILKSLNLDSVAKVKLSDGENVATVAKQEDGWTLEERSYPANFDKLFKNLRTLKEATVAQSMKAGAAYNERFGMNPEGKTAEEHGIAVSFQDASGKELEKLTIGKGTETGGSNASSSSGKFVRLGSDSDAVYVINEGLYELSADPKDWLKPGFIAVNGAKTITMKIKGEDEKLGWTATRADQQKDFTLQDISEGREAQPAALSSLKTVLSSGQFEDVLNEEEARAKSDESQARELSIETFDGFLYIVEFAPAKIAVPENLEQGTVTPASSDSYIARLSVDAELAKERKKKEGETEEQAKAADELFAKKQKELQEKLKNEKALEGIWFSLPKWVLDPANKTTNDLTKAIAISEPQSATPSAGNGPAEAVTPPIAISPMPAQDGTNNGDATQTLSEEDIRRIIEQSSQQEEEGE